MKRVLRVMELKIEISACTYAAMNAEQPERL